jgi:predicted dienelactone hydrolase
VGYTEVEFVDSERSRTLATTLWYPTTDNPNPTEQAYPSGFLGHAMKEAQPLDAPERLPLILLSHGDRGRSTNLAWLAERLVENGYLVAGIDHWLNTTLNNEPEETVRLWNRPADLSFVLTQLLDDPSWGPRIDSSRIGVAGHSSGGYTAFSLAGAIYDVDAMTAYCNSDDRGPDCDLAEEVDFEQVDFTTASESYRDERIRASFAMAPAAGNAIRVSSLAAISIPVHVVTTRRDELLDPSRNAIHYAKQTPRSTLTVEEEGGHFVYMSRCSLVSTIFTYFLEFDVCGSHSSVDRDGVQRRISKRAVTFFDENLGV